MYKPKQQDSDKNTELLKILIQNSIDNPDQYDNFVYAYNQSKKFLIVTIWSSYVFAYNNAFDTFALCALHDANENGKWAIGEKKYFTKQEILSFRKTILGQHILKLKDGTTYKFFLAPYIPTTLEGKYCLPIIQEEKIYAVLDKIKAL